MFIKRPVSEYRLPDDQGGVKVECEHVVSGSPFDSVFQHHVCPFLKRHWHTGESAIERERARVYRVERLLSGNQQVTISFTQSTKTKKERESKIPRAILSRRDLPKPF